MNNREHRWVWVGAILLVASVTFLMCSGCGPRSGSGIFRAGLVLAETTYGTMVVPELSTEDLVDHKQFVGEARDVVKETDGVLERAETLIDAELWLRENSISRLILGPEPKSESGSPWGMRRRPR